MYRDGQQIQQDSGAEQQRHDTREFLVQLRELARASQYQAFRENNPQQVLLMVKWSNIIPNGDGTYTRTPLDQDVFYRYDVQPGDLQ